MSERTQKYNDVGLHVAIEGGLETTALVMACRKLQIRIHRVQKRSNVFCFMSVKYNKQISIKNGVLVLE